MKIVFRFRIIFIVLANTTVLPAGSRCASQPCQNGGACFDFRLADGYFCRCRHPYTGFHCQIQERECPPNACGARTSEMVPSCGPKTSDLALLYTCLCYYPHPPSKVGVALNNCHDKDQLFFPKCEGGAKEIGALPFTNKGFYMCMGRKYLGYVESCPVDYVWNDTRKECIIEKVSL